MYSKNTMNGATSFKYEIPKKKYKMINIKSTCLFSVRNKNNTIILNVFLPIDLQWESSISLLMSFPNPFFAFKTP